MADNCIRDPSQECLGVEKVRALEKQFTAHLENSRETHQELFRRVNSLEQRDAVRNEQFDSINKKLDKLVAWQEEQLQNPKKRWDALIDKIVWALLAAVIAYLLAVVGL